MEDNKKTSSPRSSTSSTLFKHITTTYVEPLSPSSSSLARKFLVYKHAFRRYYDIRTTADGPIIYYGSISEFTPRTPDMKLHEGASTDGDVVAALHYGMFTRGFTIGVSAAAATPAEPGVIGISAAKGEDLEWEDVVKDSAAHGYAFSTDLAGPSLLEDIGGQGSSSQAEGRRRRFVWKRTRTVGVDGDKPSIWSNRNWKLVEAGAPRGTQEGIVAVFTSDRTLTKAGTLEIRANYGLGFDRLVFITALALYEKERRRAQNSSSGGG